MQKQGQGKSNLKFSDLRVTRANSMSRKHRKSFIVLWLVAATLFTVGLRQRTTAFAKQRIESCWRPEDFVKRENPGCLFLSYRQHTRNSKSDSWNVGGDIFEIETAKPYPDDYDAVVKQATEERESGYKPPLKSRVQDMGSYDVVFIGFPIWGMALPSPIRSFLSEHNLSGKTIVPFCTHGGYGQGQSFNTVKELSQQSNTLEGFAVDGKSAARAQPEVRKWLQEIKLIGESPAQTEPTATMRAETKAYANSIGMEFIAIAPGSFMQQKQIKRQGCFQMPDR